MKPRSRTKQRADEADGNIAPEAGGGHQEQARREDKGSASDWSSTRSETWHIGRGNWPALEERNSTTIGMFFSRQAGTVPVNITPVGDIFTYALVSRTEVTISEKSRPLNRRDDSGC